MVVFILLIVLIILASLVLFLQIKDKQNDGHSLLKESIDDFKRNTRDDFKRNREELNTSLRSNREELNQSLSKSRTELFNSFNSFEEKYSQNMKKLNEAIGDQFKNFGQEQRDQNHKTLQITQGLVDTVFNQLKNIREDNTKQLSEMRQTVNEKLQNTLERRLGESFKIVTERLEAVHKGLGEMQSLATDVGGLKKVLSNVKTRGILGEYQLENILEQILAPHQYSKNVATKKGSQANVEFAVKFPGSLDEEVWLPIDSKFPMEAYSILLDAYDKVDKKQVENQQKKLFLAIDSFAKDISEKYIDPPHTTEFGILFLPIEGLYAEIIRNTALFEKLQRKYKITIAGPTTMATMLNSFKMGFNTLVMNKKSGEVWNVLEGVKSEFKKFGGVLEKVDNQINTASKTLGILKTTRVNTIERKLREVTMPDEIIQVSNEG